MSKADLRDRENRLYALAEGQGGYFTSADAKSIGYLYPLQHFHVRRGNWIRVERGIYRLKHFPTVDHEDLIHWWLWSQKKGVISHESAAELYDLGDILPSRTHLTVPRNFRKKEPGMPPEPIGLKRNQTSLPIVVVKLPSRKALNPRRGPCLPSPISSFLLKHFRSFMFPRWPAAGKTKSVERGRVVFSNSRTATRIHRYGFLSVFPP